MLSGEHGHLGLDHQILKLQGLNKICVPDMATITNTDISDALRGIMKRLTALLQEVLPAEHSSVFLHGLLHLQSNLSSARASSRVSEHVEVGNALFTSVRG